MSNRPRIHIPTEADAPGEIDYGVPHEDDLETLARDRVEVDTLDRGDLPALVRIDAKNNDHARADYIAAKVDEALLDSAIRLSLVARIEGAAVGFLMARLDFGDFGHMEPVAAIDTIDVDPDFAGRGIGRALLSQLLTNLRALRVERVETTVASDDLGLLGFLYHEDFHPSRRLAFEKMVD